METKSTETFVNGLRNFEKEYPIVAPLPEIIQKGFYLSADMIEQYEARIKLLREVLEQIDQLAYFKTGETNVYKIKEIARVALSKCTCPISNWASLSCPKHGLDAQKGATTNEPDTAL